MRRPARPVPAAVLLAALLAAAPATAAQWYAAPRVAQSLGYDDNVRLDSDGGEAAMTSTSSLGLTLGGRSPRLDLRLDARLDYNAYAGGDQEDTHVETLALAASRRLTARTRLGLNAGFVRDTSIDDTLDDTGRERRTSDPRYTLSATPFLGHQLTPLDSLDAALSWRWRDDTGPGDDDFTTLSGNLGWQRTVTRRTRLGANLYLSHFRSDEQRSSTASPRAFVGFRETERVDLDLSLGPSLSPTETREDNAGTGEGARTDLGVTVDGNLRYRLTPVTSLTLTASHYIEPAGSDGDVSQTTRLSTGLGHRLSRRLSLNASLLAQRQQRVVSDAGDNRDYLQASAGLAWVLTPQLDLGLSYRLRHEHSDEDGTATSNAVFVTLAFRFQERRASW